MAAQQQSAPDQTDLDRVVFPPVESPAELAWTDLREAIGLSWFWTALGWLDILQRYRGSMLGPFWLTITTGVFIAGLGPLYAQLFSLNMADYLPYMALGVTIWGFIVSTINECCGAFISTGHVMKQIRLPRMALLLQVVWRNILAFLHTWPIFVVIFLYFGTPLRWEILLVVPGFIILCLNLIWIGLLAAILCARFRDITPIITSVLQIGFFVTPVIWSYKQQSVHAAVVNLNPLAAFLEVVRAPLLGEAAPAPLMYLALACIVFGYAVSWWVFVRCRKYIVYWV
jgi:ABC-type polysaccharide/polyol phosphate export permease